MFCVVIVELLQACSHALGLNGQSAFADIVLLQHLHFNSRLDLPDVGGLSPETRSMLLMHSAILKLVHTAVPQMLHSADPQ